MRHPGARGTQEAPRDTQGSSIALVLLEMSFPSQASFWHGTATLHFVAEPPYAGTLKARITGEELYCGVY